MTVIQIVRKLLTPDEISNPNQRYNADCDCIQTSYDGGATWTATPDADPRHFPGFLFSPLVADDPQCLAAGNMTDRIKTILDIIIVSSTIFECATGLINVLLVLLPGAGILIDLVLAAAEALFTLGLAAVDSSLTSDVYDQLLCIIYFEIDASGQCSADAYNSIRSHVDSQIGGTAAIAIDYALDQLGEVGLSNAGTLGESTRDCSGCVDTWCYLFDSSNIFEDWTAVSYAGAVAAWNSTDGNWQSQFASGASSIWITQSFDSRTLTDCDMAQNNSSARAIYANGDGSAFSGTLIFQNGTKFNLPLSSVTRVDLYNIQVGANVDLRVSACKLAGDGTNPFGDDTC